MAESLELSISQEVINGIVRRTIRLHKTGTTGESDQVFYYDLLGESEPPIPNLLDGFVLGVIFLVMQHGRPLRVHGMLSRNAVYNLAEFQSAWSCWRPTKYRRIDLLPDQIVDLPATSQAPRAISAFSGGVDGTFTAIRHARKLLGNASFPLTDVMLVHGFDIPLNKPESFARLLHRIRPLVDELGLGIKLVRTNLKEASGQDWEDSFGAQLASCLHNFSDSFQYALMGSGEPYSEFTYPWGSTPATDYLMSGDQMRLVLDGSAYSRTEKLAEIAGVPTAVRGLKVCWEGADPERNCGHCEKCLRTKLNLLAVGIANPACFDDGLDLNQIRNIPIRNVTSMVELKSIYHYAQAHHVTGEWVDKLKERITPVGQHQSIAVRLAQKISLFITKRRT